MGLRRDLRSFPTEAGYLQVRCPALIANDTSMIKSSAGESGGAALDTRETGAGWWCVPRAVISITPELS